MHRLAACLLLLLASPATTRAATVDFAFDDAGAVIAQGSFTYPTGATGHLTYADLTAFTFQIGNGALYDLAYVDSGAISVFRDFDYDIASASFLSTDLYGYPQILTAIGQNFDTGFFVRFDSTYKEVEDYAGGGILPIDQIVVTPAPTRLTNDVAVPEPAPLGLFAAALASLAILRRRR